MGRGLKQTETAMEMYDPPHPGESIRYDCLVDGMDATKAAQLLGVDRDALEDVMNGAAPVTPHLAQGMERLGWSTAACWLRLQAIYDRAQEHPRHNRAAVQLASA